jgi:hypothetical protein
LLQQQTEKVFSITYYFNAWNKINVPSLKKRNILYKNRLHNIAAAKMKQGKSENNSRDIIPGTKSSYFCTDKKLTMITIDD